MRVTELMTQSPTCCPKETPLPEVAKLMLTHDCGMIPVEDDGRVVGVVTDRDIAIRCVAAARDPNGMKAGDCMSHPIVTVPHTVNVEDCLKIMEENQIRRAVIVDERENCRGVLSQADIALRMPKSQTAELVQEVSQPEILAAEEMTDSNRGGTLM